MAVIEQLLVTLQHESDFLLTLATVDTDGLPRVRYMKGVIDKQLIIRCPTFALTEKVRQIQDCANVLLTCGDTDSSQSGSYFQVAARAEISQAQDDRIAAWTPRMEKWFSRPNDVNYAVETIRIHMFPIGSAPHRRCLNCLARSS